MIYSAGEALDIDAVFIADPLFRGTSMYRNLEVPYVRCTTIRDVPIHGYPYTGDPFIGAPLHRGAFIFSGSLMKGDRYIHGTVYISRCTSTGVFRRAHLVLAKIEVTQSQFQFSACEPQAIIPFLAQMQHPYIATSLYRSIFM